MSGRVRHISKRKYPKQVAILSGAPAVLVAMREQRGQHVIHGKAYDTNRHIKYWATWFLLKSLTSTSYIQHWIHQKKHLLHWLQLNENTFRRHLAWLKENGLAETSKINHSIRLCSYEKAASVLGIEYDGTYPVSFNPDKCKGKQTFAYLLRVEEFEHHKQRQLAALMYKIDNNLSLKNDLLYHLIQFGADYNRLQSDPAYYAERLLRLQIRLFRDGSDIFQYIMQLRADVNRGAKKIKQHHQYRSCQSVAYMKRKISALGLARVWSIAIESDARMRFSIPAQADTPIGRTRNGMQDGYKWVKDKGKTMWRLTDQVSRLYDAQMITNELMYKNQKNVA